jgi:hypothetical protein
MGHNSFCFAEVVNELGENINIIKQNPETPLDASKEVCLEGNGERSKYVSMPRRHATPHNHYTKATNKSFENVAKFKYL